MSVLCNWKRIYGILNVLLVRYAGISRTGWLDTEVVLCISLFQGTVDVETLLKYLNIFLFRTTRQSHTPTYGWNRHGRAINNRLALWSGASVGVSLHNLGALKFNCEQEVLSSDHSFSIPKHGRNALLTQPLELTCRNRSDDRENPPCAARVSMVFRFLVVPNRWWLYSTYHLNDTGLLDEPPSTSEHSSVSFTTRLEFRLFTCYGVQLTQSLTNDFGKGQSFVWI